jgi:hypothetical protein
VTGTHRESSDHGSLLAEEPYRSMIVQARGRALVALEHYGEPRVSVQALRQATQAVSISLSDAVLAERLAGW